MILRPYNYGSDFETVKDWCGDRRTHAVWCAGRFPYPLGEESFEAVLKEHSDKYGDIPFIAEDEDGKAVGFLCYSANTDTNEGMIKFVIVDPSLRGRGYGKAMLRQALGYAFDETCADSVRLCVFSHNAGALRCYESVGFKEISTDPGAFSYENEAWDRCRMAIQKTNYRRQQ